VAEENPAPPPPPSAEVVVVPAGSRLRERADPHSATLTLIDEDTPLAPLERRGGWILVRWRSWKAWVLIGGEPDYEESGPAAEPGPLSGPTPAWTLLRLQRSDRRAVLFARLKHRLRSPARPLPFGIFLAGSAEGSVPTAAFSLYTDATDVGLIKKLEAAADSVVRFYDEHLVIVREDTRDVFLLGSSPGMTDTKVLKELRSVGLVSLPAGAPVEVLVARLVHEMAHVLNRPVGIPIPAWLDEGLAVGLSSSTFDSSGALRIEALTPGARRAVDRLTAELSTGRPLALSAIARAPSGCVAGAEKEMARPEAAMLARYVVTAAPRGALKGLLVDAVARGRAVKDAEILRALGRDEAALERHFRVWLAGQGTR
jgi:hypothetical protein